MTLSVPSCFAAATSASIPPLAAELVKLRYFVGLTIADAAAEQEARTADAVG